MGRSKLPIKKIENTTNRQVTFSKRRYGLIKKAYEISVLCDIDLAIIMFSSSGRLSHFSGRKRIEDVIYRYLNLSDPDRGGTIHNKEKKSIFQPESDKFALVAEFQSCEVRLVEALRRVTQRKRFLLSKVGEQSSYHDTILEINTVVQYITEAQTRGGFLENHFHELGNGISELNNNNAGSDASSVDLRV
ncbi:agamous-like MADS-box protein AGL66 [Primulina tabacum]|uniref:agamous-like MADS-box protein AGL66 n=1 Tax=Primulina tabacum TaxID=48773 RepID=UPI003F596ACA